MKTEDNLTQDTRPSLFSRLKRRYRIVLYNEESFDEVGHLHVNSISVLAIVGAICILLIVGSMALVMFTPLKEMVPGYPDASIKQSLIRATMRLDSLESEIAIRDQYFEVLQAITRGEDTLDIDTLAIPNTSRPELSFERSKADSLMRIEVESQMQKP